MKKKYDEVMAVRSLARKSEIKIIGDTIFVAEDSTEVGNNSWGKIDFLTKYHGYLLRFFVKTSNSDEIKSKKKPLSKAEKKARKENAAIKQKINLKNKN